MFIKSMVIDGFKSYGTRTEVNGFDHQFNAITGLNGSGKSNILDSICFLLGITKLEHVRATNLQELVYKNGQAGVTKATVSVTFDNRHKAGSPMGYDHYDEITITRQVVIGGKNKYLINGTTVQNNRIQDFFRSVQLNVNNPHFLIMQGRITKVLNMKPPEILAMIEEAAGTMMYESKKQQAQKTIEKKDQKLKEINNILNEEINPTLTKLRQERSAYLEFQKIQRELEHLTKLYVAWKFNCAKEMSDKTKAELEQVKVKLQELQEAIEAGKKEVEELEATIKELSRARDDEMGGDLEMKEKECAEVEKNDQKLTSGLKAIKDTVKQEEKKKKTINKGLTDDQKALAEKEKTINSLQATFDKLREQDETCKAALEAAQTRYQAISLGQFADEDGQSATLEQQIMKQKENMAKAGTEIKAADSKVKTNTEQLKKKQIEMKKTEAEFKRDSNAVGKFEKDVIHIQNQLRQINYEEGTSERLEMRQRELKQQVNTLNQQCQGVNQRYPTLNFIYKDPEPRFDRSLVYGPAATLFDVKDQMFCQAIETAAGGKLYNIVIANDVVGKSLLQRGKLQRRTTFMPLNKMTGSDISQNVIQRAKQVGGRDNVWFAKELINYPAYLEPAMTHLCGRVLICRDLDIATKVAYDRQVMTLCVTLEGDKVNPSGEMSGGAANRGGSMLAYLFANRDSQRELETKQKELQQVQADFGQIQNIAQQWGRLSEQLELKQHEFEMIKQRLEQTAHHQLDEEVKQLAKEIEDIKTGVEKAKTVVSEGEKKVKDLEYKIKNAKAIKEKELKEADTEVKKCKKSADESRKQWSNKEQEEASMKQEIEVLKTGITEAEDQLKAVDESMKGYEEQIKTAEEEVSTAREAVKTAKEAVKVQKDLLAAQNREIKTRGDRRDHVIKQNEQRELDVQQQNHAVTKAEDDVKAADRRVVQYKEQHEWIAEDEKFFGVANTAYDFNVTDPEEAGRRIQKLEATKDKLGKSVNMRAMNMLGKAEEQYMDLCRKKKIVENDKEKIQNVIAELDEKKKTALRQAWEQVNKDFGSIFSSLLPDTTAKLSPPEGKDVLDGLEVKVAFGGVWKESLNELSGGQRSLVALSLILSLLLFKPAPLYILDEVDAALDLSHTQNIGNMLKTHFKASQFIVVSLKDGMFNNANVLFRTKFVDGMSTVSRNVQNQKKK